MALPEPGLFLFGSIHGMDLDLERSDQQLEFSISMGIQSLRLEADWVGVNERLYYRIRIPFERTSFKGIEIPLNVNASSQALTLSDQSPVKLKLVPFLENATAQPWIISADALHDSLILTLESGFRARSLRLDIEMRSESGRDSELAAWAKKFFGDPDAELGGDTDGDGLSDYEEFLVSSDPTLASSALAIHGLEVTTEGFFALEWAVFVEGRYQVERRLTLSGKPEMIGDIVAAPGVTRFVDSNLPKDAGPVVYRIVFVP